MVPFPTLFVMVSAGFMMAALATLLDDVSSVAVAARPNPVKIYVDMPSKECPEDTKNSEAGIAASEFLVMPPTH
ncbi:hypothetical protein [Methylorubrum extorquens]|jgi:hypothetical protein|uniref:Uncharacterized protein n=4 Tax=Methylorubrum extorquens TaxID=408 RepID=B7KPC9_METC4|nr:hypothetical protein [Methylorubrum extorquens]AWI91577.1 hypothetical protein C0214_06855 [Methylobacterium sp. DM1]ACK82012.1 hypothetical protein Mchl_1114 [Methylorubrum extorquens CM4]EHP93505.1 hypothetical protein MetexDRAFT_1635 [Methylorubrum extorquens DSM 13060]MCP1545822.1 hypothetical protein [Methylorubrum extorquens]MCP1591773.1 hypothetical protein [Methylorubrum extorquens]